MRLNTIDDWKLELSERTEGLKFRVAPKNKQRFGQPGKSFRLVCGNYKHGSLAFTLTQLTHGLCGYTMSLAVDNRTNHQKRMKKPKHQIGAVTVWIKSVVDNPDKQTDQKLDQLFKMLHDWQRAYEALP